MSGGGSHHFRRDHLTDQLRLAQTVQARGRENNGIVVTGFEFPQPRVDIATERMNLQIWTQRHQLRLPSQTAGANVRLLRQRVNARELHRAKHVARIFAGRNGGNFEIGGQLRGQILQAVHGEVNPVFDQGFFDFLGEHALGADFRQRHVGDFIARSLDDLEFHGVALSAQQVGDVVGLPECELRAARADAEAGHQFCAPFSELFSEPRPRPDFEAAVSFSSSPSCRLS